MNKKVFVSIIAVLLGLITLMVLCEISCAETVEPFTVSAYQCEGVLTIVPNTCGELSHVEILTNPPAHFKKLNGGVYQGATTAINGYFSAILCENNSCTPVEFDFDVTVYSGNAPTPAGAITPADRARWARWAHWAGVTGLVVAFSLVAFAIFRILLSRWGYDGDQWG